MQGNSIETKVLTCRKIWRYLIFIALGLAIVSAVLMGFLPDGKMGSKSMENASLYWLLLGSLHCLACVLMTVSWLIKRQEDANAVAWYRSTKVAIVISLLVIWLFFVVPLVKSGYIRNKHIIVDTTGREEKGAGYFLAVFDNQINSTANRIYQATSPSPGVAGISI